MTIGIAMWVFGAGTVDRLKIVIGPMLRPMLANGDVDHVLFADIGSSHYQFVDYRMSFVKDMKEALRRGLIVQPDAFVPLVEPFQVCRIIANLAVDHLPQFRSASRRKLSRASGWQLAPASNA